MRPFHTYSVRVVRLGAAILGGCAILVSPAGEPAVTSDPGNFGPPAAALAQHANHRPILNFFPKTAGPEAPGKSSTVEDRAGPRSVSTDPAEIAAGTGVQRHSAGGLAGIFSQAAEGLDGAQPRQDATAGNSPPAFKIVSRTDGPAPRRRPVIALPTGHIDTVRGGVQVTRADGSRDTLREGDPIFQGDIIETAENGSMSLVMADDTVFSLDTSGEVSMDEMVFDAAAQSGRLHATLIRGVFSFVSGQIASTDPDAMELRTPVATIGIRGTTGALHLPEGENLTVVLAPNRDGAAGELVISN